MLMRKTVAFLLLIWLVSFNAGANQTSLQQEFVMPNECILGQHQLSCALNIKLTWQSAKPISSCIYIDNVQQQCWSATTEINQRVNLVLTSSATIKLVNITDKKLLYAQDIKLRWIVSAKRRKLRSAWSIF